jgi:NTE family protein
MNCLNDTNLRYVTESGTIIEVNGTEHGHTTIIDAILASAAIPTFFNARNIGNETYVDGGLREVIPIRAAINAGAGPYDVIAVNPSAPYGSSPPDGTITPEDFSAKNWQDIAYRALDLYDAETQEKSTFPTGGWGPDVKLQLIRPEFEVHSSREIESAAVMGTCQLLIN